MRTASTNSCVFDLIPVHACAPSVPRREALIYLSYTSTGFVLRPPRQHLPRKEKASGLRQARSQFALHHAHHFFLRGPYRAIFKLPGLVKLTKTEPFTAWFVVSGDATADEIRVVRSVLGAMISLPIVASRAPSCASFLPVNFTSFVKTTY